MNILLDIDQGRVLDSSGDDLLFKDIPVPINPYHQGQYSTGLAALSSITISEIAYPKDKVRPSLKELDEMQKRDPVVSQCIQFKSLRAVQNFGDYSHPRKEIETFINSNLLTLSENFKGTLFRMISSVLLYGSVFAEYTLTSKTRGFTGQWRLAKINILDPNRIQSITGKRGKIEFIKYDKGDGQIVDIPYSKCIHIINNSGALFDEDTIWGLGDGASALNYYKLKRVVLTQLALATKNNSTGIIHAQTPDIGRTILVDSKMVPIKGTDGKPLEVTKQIALNHQLQDLYKKDYIVTGLDTEIKRIQIQNNENFWEYVLNYIDKSIQRAFGVPVGIFDSGVGGIQNVGLSQNFKSVFDSTIYALTTLLKDELIIKIIKKLLIYNFPLEWFKDHYGEFRFEAEEDPSVSNQRLSTITSLVASGILPQNDPEILTLIKKSLGLPTLDEEDKELQQAEKAKIKAQEDLQYQLQELQTQMQMMQMQMQMQQMQNPQPPTDPNAEGASQEDYPAA